MSYKIPDGYHVRKAPAAPTRKRPSIHVVSNKTMRSLCGKDARSWESGPEFGAGDCGRCAAQVLSPTLPKL
jgi:hypothetical protein